MAISKDIRESMEKSSWIRKMFEEGGRLKAQFGEENVFDFSLGNPDLEPPDEFFRRLKSLAESRVPGVHGYMANAGFMDVRTSIAGKVSRENGVMVGPESIVMTCGAAGGLNVIFKTLLDPGDQVIVIRPFFVEYASYIKNHGGEMVLAESSDDFSLNIDSIARAITERTRAILINSPNNPTGKIYTEKELKDLAEMLLKNSNRGIYLIADEPYRDIVYDNVKVPSILKIYRQSIVTTSYSKSLSIPGERIGYICANPESEDFPSLMNGMILANRILGFVNAPGLMQRVVAGLNDAQVDVATYRKRRDLFLQGLEKAGYRFIRPEGAFYIFCVSPIDDIKFVSHLQKYNILTVPGTGFGQPGYFRIAFCVSEDIIRRSLPKFEEALRNI